MPTILYKDPKGDYSVYADGKLLMNCRIRYIGEDRYDTQVGQVQQVAVDILGVTATADIALSDLMHIERWLPSLAGPGLQLPQHQADLFSLKMQLAEWVTEGYPAPVTTEYHQDAKEGFMHLGKVLLPFAIKDVRRRVFRPAELRSMSEWDLQRLAGDFTITGVYKGKEFTFHHSLLPDPARPFRATTETGKSLEPSPSNQIQTFIALRTVWELTINRPAADWITIKRMADNGDY